MKQKMFDRICRDNNKDKLSHSDYVKLMLYPRLDKPLPKHLVEYLEIIEYEEYIREEETLN